MLRNHCAEKYLFQCWLVCLAGERYFMLIYNFLPSLRYAFGGNILYTLKSNKTNQYLNNFSGIKIGITTVMRATRSKNKQPNTDSSTSDFKKVSDTEVKESKSQISSKKRRHIKIRLEETCGSTSDLTSSPYFPSTEDSVINEKEPKWEPPNWQQVLINIREMRKHKDAPVDDMGCDKCMEDNAAPEVK